MTACQSMSLGGVYGAPFMKFTLTFDGELVSNGAPRDKWAIRQQFHPQLQELWRVHPSLVDLNINPTIPLGGFWNIERHHSLGPGAKNTNRPDPSDPHMELCPPIPRKNRSFLPLVRNSLALKCGLK